MDSLDRKAEPASAAGLTAAMPHGSLNKSQPAATLKVDGYVHLNGSARKRPPPQRSTRRRSDLSQITPATNSNAIDLQGKRDSVGNGTGQPIPSTIGTPVKGSLAPRVSSQPGSQPIPLKPEAHDNPAPSSEADAPRKKWNILDFREAAVPRKRKSNGGGQPRLLILGGGSNSDPSSIGNRLAQNPDEARNALHWPVSPCPGTNYDQANGEHLNIVDDAVMDELRYDVSSGRYAAAIAFPEQSTFIPQDHPSGPHPYRSAEGPGRYKIKGLPPDIAEKVRVQNLVAVRTAELLDLFWIRKRPFIIGVAAIRPGHVSVAHLYEYRKLMSLEGVTHSMDQTKSWIQHRVDVSDLRADGSPTELTNRYLISKLKLAMDVPSPYDDPRSEDSQDTPAAQLKAARFNMKENISWKNRLCGFVPPTEKEEADRLAIGGLRDAAASVGRLSTVAAFGRRMYGAIRDVLVTDRKHNQDQGTPSESWINVTCDAIGSKEERLPPEAAIEAIKAIMVQYTAAVPADSRFEHLTNVDAHLLEAWRKAAGDPDDQVYQWLTQGAPAGILHPILDPGIFPDTSGPSATHPDELGCDEATFRNYAGVEENVATETELQSHIDMQHIIAFDTCEELTEYVGGGKVILNKIGLIEKVRNGKKKVRMILDTKQSDVKRITGKAQRVTLPRLFDAVLHMLSLMSLFAGDVGAFVLDFTNAFWQVPINRREQRFFCATALFTKRRGKKKFARGRGDKEKQKTRKYMAWKRAAQGSAAGPRFGDAWRHNLCETNRLVSAVGTVVEIGTDASPWGMGGWRTIDGRLTHFFSSPITPTTSSGTSDGHNSGSVSQSS